MKELEKALRNAGFVVISDDTSLLAGKRDDPITFGEVLEAIYPQSIDIELYDYVVKAGVVRIFERNSKPGRTSKNGNKMTRPQVGPALDERAQEAREWYEGLTPEARMMQIVYRYEDWHRDQQQALEWRMGDE